MNLDNLYKRISERGLTLKKVSEETGVSTGLLSEWKNGNRMPSVTTLEKVADFLDCSMDYLIGRSSDPNPIHIPSEITAKLSGIFDDFIHQDELFYLPSDKKNYLVRIKDYYKVIEIYDTAYKYNSSILNKEDFEKLFTKYDNIGYRLLNSDCYAIDVKDYHYFEDVYGTYVEYYFNMMIDRITDDTL